MATISKKDKEEEEGKQQQRQQQVKNGYWQNELYSLGILEPNRKKREELNENKAEELQNLADNIKQAMFEDYKLAYSDKGDMYKEEAKPTVTVG